MAEEQGKLLAYIVDDESAVTKLIVAMLSSKFGQGIEFRTYSNGAEAYAAIQGQKPDLLFTDVQMPEMSGDVLLERLVNDGIKVPALVASSSTVDLQGARAMFYSHRMYTPEQAGQLNLPTRQNVEEQERYADLQISAQRAKTRELMQAGEEYPNVPYDFGANILTKPFCLNQLLSQTQTIVETVYGK